MKPDFRGSAIKTAHTEDEAVKYLGKFDKKLNIVIDKRGSVLSNIEIEQI